MKHTIEWHRKNVRETSLHFAIAEFCRRETQRALHDALGCGHSAEAIGCLAIDLRGHSRAADLWYGHLREAKRRLVKAMGAAKQA